MAVAIAVCIAYLIFGLAVKDRYDRPACQRRLAYPFGIGLLTLMLLPPHDGEEAFALSVSVILGFNAFFALDAMRCNDQSIRFWGGLALIIYCVNALWGFAAYLLAMLEQPGWLFVWLHDGLTAAQRIELDEKGLRAGDCFAIVLMLLLCALLAWLITSFSPLAQKRRAALTVIAPILPWTALLLAWLAQSFIQRHMSEGEIITKAGWIMPCIVAWLFSLGSAARLWQTGWRKCSLCVLFSLGVLLHLTWRMFHSVVGE